MFVWIGIKVSCFFSYKGIVGIKIEWLVFKGVLSFYCCSSPDSYQSSLNGPSRLSQGLATRDALKPGYAAVLSSSQHHSASMYLFAVVIINWSFSQVLQEVLTGLKFCLVSCLTLSYLQCKEESDVAQLCLTLCDPMDCSPTRLLCPWDFPGKNPGVGCYFLLQGIFPTQRSNPGLPHCGQTLYHLGHHGSPELQLLPPGHFHFCRMTSHPLFHFMPLASR